MWRLIMVHQLSASNINTPMTARDKSIDHLITTYPQVLSQLQSSVNTVQTHIAIFFMDQDKE